LLDSLLQEIKIIQVRCLCVAADFTCSGLEVKLSH